MSQKSLYRLNKKQLLTLCKKEGIELKGKHNKKTLIGFLSKNRKQKSVIDLDFQLNANLNTNENEKLLKKKKVIVTKQETTRRKKLLEDIKLFKFKKQQFMHLQKINKTSKNRFHNKI